MLCAVTRRRLPEHVRYRILLKFDWPACAAFGGGRAEIHADPCGQTKVTIYPTSLQHSRDTASRTADFLWSSEHRHDTRIRREAARTRQRGRSAGRPHSITTGTRD